MQTLLQSLRRIAPAVALAAAFALLAGRASAEMFYMEEKKDDRIYVFAVGENYRAFQNGGETGMTTITRIGEGPNGETMVFDSRDAVNLYNFKHDRPSEVFPAEKGTPSPKFSWKDGKTTFSSEFATMTLSNRIQLRYTYELPDLADDATGNGDKQSFRVRRAKTAFEGWIYNPTLTYKLQWNWPDTANPLEDAWLDWDVSGGAHLLHIRPGQQKTPFGRQEFTSSGSQQFADRSQVSNEFAKGYDLGLSLWGQLFGGKLEWRAAATNGNGRTQAANDNRKFQYTGRLMYQPFGDVKFSESDFESTDSPLLAFAVGYNDNDAMSRGNTTKTDLATETASADVAFKYRGFSAVAEYFDQDRTQENNDNGVFKESSRKGWYLQSGYFVWERKLEVAARYGVIDLDTAKDDDDLIETGIVVNWFLNRHPLKVQADFRILEDETKKTKNKEARVQLQFIF
jgi:phosphate-selective porin OprO and OprP